MHARALRGRAHSDFADKYRCRPHLSRMSAQIKDNRLSFPSIAGMVSKSLDRDPVRIELKAQGISEAPVGRFDTARLHRWRCYIRLNEEQYEISLDTYAHLIRLFKLGPGQALVLHV